MKKLLSSVFALAISFLFLPSAFAATLTAAENLVMTEKIIGDAYLVGGNASIDADITGDLYIAGGIVTINSNIGQDLVVAGGKVTVVGNVLGDIRLLGGQLAVYGKVGEDIIFAGGSADVGKTAFVNGSVIVTAGILTIDGQVKENVRGVMGMLLLNGTVGQNVSVTVEDSMSIADTAKILGSLEYSSLFESKIPAGVVSGTVIFNKFEKQNLLGKFTYWYFVEKLFSFLSAILLALIFVLFAPKALLSAAENTKKAVLKSFGIGLLTMIFAIVGGLILMISVIGIPLALIILAGLLIVFYTSQVFVAAWLGSYFFDYKKFKKIKIFGILLLTMLVYHLVGIVPYLGIAVHLVLFLLGVGSIVMMKMDIMKFLKGKKML